MPPSARNRELAATTEGDARWSAVVARSPGADGTFVYSVRTTGVYCRPSCGARRARPEHVRFHTGPAEAEQAGFRACRRCRPDQPSRAEQHAALVVAACRMLELADPVPTLGPLAAEAGMSPFHFHRVFRSVTGVTPKAYATAHRGRRVRRELAKRGRVSAAIYDAGYGSSGGFYQEATEVLGMRPAEYREGGLNAEIRFALGQCSLGAILVARSTRGVCAIHLGDDPEALVRELQDRFPHATLIGGDAEFEALVARVVGLVEAPGVGTELPLDVQGTAFQQRVWRALREIPAGTTASYTEIARRIGAPTAVRAVARACAANPLAVAIPCHRVVRTDGALSGYRWGVERKRTLLGREREGVGG
jgi:AraC family transcriptional regulator of adaptative response/methylated-DNA-[protein]-cysteine methyltransferase